MNKLAALFAIALAAACSADPGMDMDNPDVDPNDVTAPTVLSISPADGAAGIHRDSAITLKFSEAMDQLSVQNSLESAELGAVSYEWTDGGKTLRVVPAQPLEYAEGTGIDPETTPALAYEVVLSDGATDLMGNPAERGIKTSFTTLKRIEHTLVRENEQTGSGNPAGVTTDSDDFLAIGDDDNGDQANGYRGYVTIDMSPLPASALEITEATLRGQQLFTLGEPYLELGNGAGVILDHGIFQLGPDGNEHEAFNMAPLSQIGEFARKKNDIALTIDVSNAVNDDLQNREDRLDRSQFRLRFDGYSNLDNVADAVYIGRDELAIDLTYLAP